MKCVKQIYLQIQFVVHVYTYLFADCLNGHMHAMHHRHPVFYRRSVVVVINPEVLQIPYITSIRQPSLCRSKNPVIRFLISFNHGHNIRTFMDRRNPGHALDAGFAGLLHDT